eukprot:CAMPEP_0194100354 /NCGR_PEP_ID=MMETSP0150-20130528/1238_1 /TAXON_ID=122233 /ORGANISM="Chaetoceros debilis, Strain MM31A-1" /LENGTH=203 /DNA_ID=CAMNT_0038786705 /DNA_START=39 /DNA_END=650 /DNA_ORIENTATION=-
MKLAILTTLITAASAFVTPGARAPTKTFLRAEEEAAAADDEVPEFRGAMEIAALTASINNPVFDSEEISRTLPHRYPFLLVDKVIEYEAGKRAVGLKAITANEPQFTGHFPDRPIMPGVLQVEALAQLAGIVCLKSADDPGAVFFFAGADRIKWKRPVVPGEILVMEVEIVRFRRGLAKATGKGYVNGELAIEVGSMTFALAK